MRWRDARRSTNVEDRRRLTPGRVAAGGGIGAILAIVAALLFGGDPGEILRGLAGPGSPAAPVAGEEERAEFVSVVLGDTETVWQELFRGMNRRYEEPVLVLFRDRVRWAGGVASSAMGPFYSPADRKVFLDMSFFDELQRRFGAPGDFAQAYVIAHEVGHHVQNLLGISDRVHAQRGRVDEREYNRLSVRLELQADFLAGVWAHHAQKARAILEEGDLEEALRAATAIGDDRLQKQAQGYAVPDSFTHGTSAQRVAWFRHGFRTGLFAEGDTFDEAHFRRISPE